MNIINYCHWVHGYCNTCTYTCISLILAVHTIFIKSKLDNRPNGYLGIYDT